MKLRLDDFNFMLKELRMPEQLRTRVLNLVIPVNVLTVEELDLLRDLVGERLQEVGFDNGCEPTDKGRRLEALVDALYTG